MPRRTKNVQHHQYEPISIKELCRRLGITPQQRVKLFKSLEKGVKFK